MSQTRYASLYERLIANTRVEGACWIWTGATNGRGRPRINIRRDGKHCACNAARVMLDLFYVLDDEAEASHLCTESWLCINPDHLLPETKQQNMARRWGKPLPAGREWAARGGDDDIPFDWPSIPNDREVNSEKFPFLLLTAPSIATILQTSQHANGV